MSIQQQASGISPALLIDRRSRARTHRAPGAFRRFASAACSLLASFCVASSAAQAAGLSAGDVIVAVNGIRTGAGGLDAAVGRLRPGDSVELHVFRRDELHVMRARLSSPASDTCNLRVEPEVAVRLRRRWLGA